MEIKIKKLYKEVLTPSHGSEYAAGYDLYAYLGGYDECTIEPHQTFKIGTGIAMEIPEGYFGALFARSGLASKKGLRPANCVGVVDSDYRGEIRVAVHNDTDEPQKFYNNERIAQLVVIPCLSVKFTEVDTLSETERGSGGFGSTGKTKLDK